MLSAENGEHVVHCYSPAVLGTSGPFWGRQYLFWHGDQPLTLIHEVFSPHIAQYLGQSSSNSNGSRLDR